MGLPCIAFLAYTIFVYAKAARVIQNKFRVPENQSGSNAWKEQINAIFE